MSAVATRQPPCHTTIDVSGGPNEDEGLDQIDTTASGGELIFQVLGALPDFERDLIR